MDSRHHRRLDVREGELFRYDLEYIADGRSANLLESKNLRTVSSQIPEICLLSLGK